MTFARLGRPRSVPALVALLAAGLLALVLPAGAPADVIGAGPAEYPAAAYGPVAPGQVVPGAFSGPADVDYLSFVVARAGETLQFTVRNTTAACQDPFDAGCPVYLTLMDPTGLSQVGGATSDAGTIATYGDTETFTWAFDAPGTYYMLLESDGDLPGGSPTYGVAVTLPAAPPSSGSGGSGSGGSGAGGSGAGGSGAGGSGSGAGGRARARVVPAPARCRCSRSSAR